MAIFNPAPNPTNDPEYLRYSKEPDRVQANTAAGKFAEGLGGLLGNGMKGLDIGIADAMKKQARDLIEPIRDAHGADVTPDEVPAIAGTGSRSSKYDTLGVVEDTSAVPKQFAQNLAGLKRVSDAYGAGAMSDSHYYSSLESAVKELRARFPGYEEQIDNAVKDITGVIPANALRSSILRDMNSLQAAAGSADKDNNKWYDANEKYIHAAQPGITRAQAIANRAQLEPVIGDMQGQDYLIDAKKKRLDLKGEVNKDTAKEYYELATERLNTDLSRLLQGVGSARGLSFQQVQDRIKAMGPVPDSAAVQALSSEISMLKAQAIAQMDETLNKVSPDGKRSYAQVITAHMGRDALKDLKASALSPINAIEELIGNKSPGLANVVHNIASNRGSEDEVRLGNASPQARAVATIRKMVGDQTAQIVVEQTSVIKDALELARTQKGVFSTVNPDNPNPPPSFDQYIRQQGEAARKTVSGTSQRASLNSFIALTDAKDPQIAGRAVAVLYQSPEFFNGLPQAQQMQVFTRMAKPEMTQKIEALEKSVPGVKAQYTQWVERAFGSMFSQGISDTQSAIDYDRLDVKFDPNNWRFTGRIKDFDKVKAAYPNAVDSTGTYFDKINQGMAIMKPALEASYGKEQALGRMFSLMTERGLNTGAEARPGTLDSLAKVVSESLGSLDFVSGLVGMPKKEKKGNLSDNPVMNIKWDDIPEGVDAREFFKSLQQGKRSPTGR